MQKKINGQVVFFVNNSVYDNVTLIDSLFTAGDQGKATYLEGSAQPSSLKSLSSYA
jgi:hypothetical protein